MAMAFMRLTSAAMLATLALATTVAAPQAQADQFDFARQQEYEDCMTLARRVPADGYESALAWESQGGGRRRYRS